MDASLSSFLIFVLGSLRGEHADRSRQEVLAQLTQILRRPDFDPNMRNEREEGVLEALAKPWPGVSRQEEYPWLRGDLATFAWLSVSASPGYVRPEEHLVGEWLMRGGDPFPADRPWAGVLAHLERRHIAVVRTLLADSRRPAWSSDAAACAWEAVLRLDSVPLAAALVENGCPAPLRLVQGLPQWGQVKSAEVFTVLAQAYPGLFEAPAGAAVLSAWAAREGKADAALCGLLRDRLSSGNGASENPIDLVAAFEATLHRTWSRLAPLVQNVSDLCSPRQWVPELPGETENLVEKLIREALEGVEFEGSAYIKATAALKRTPVSALGQLLVHPGVSVSSKALIGVFLETWREWMENEFFFEVEEDKPALLKTLNRLSAPSKEAYLANKQAAWETWGKVLARASSRIVRRATGQPWDSAVDRLQRYVRGIAKVVESAEVFEDASHLFWRASVPMMAAAHDNDWRMPGVWEERLEAWNRLENSKEPLLLEDAKRLWWLLRGSKAISSSEASLVKRVEAALTSGLAQSETTNAVAQTIQSAAELVRPCPGLLQEVQARLTHAVLVHGLPSTPSAPSRPRL